MTNKERRATIERYFTLENERPETQEEISPSGRYRLVVHKYATRKGCWDYSRGVVYRVADAVEVCDIKRNYSTFHHSFVVKDGQEWLIAGRSYMSQTIVNLDLGREYEPDGDHYVGNAFCWASCYLSPDRNTLAVDGCVWACPWEYRFFDFTLPALGWPALPISGDVEIEAVGDKAPIWFDDGTFECYEATGPRGQEVVNVRTRLRREGRAMVVVDRWMSDEERQRREEEARREAEFDEWSSKYRAEDRLYRKVRLLIAQFGLPGELYVSTRNNQPTVLAYFRRRDPQASADVSWKVDGGPIAVRFYGERRQTHRDVEFKLDDDGVQSAMELIAQHFLIEA
jgi:hypothetical protein